VNTKAIIRATERMLTLAKRAAVSEDRDTRRAELVAVFSRLATDMGKVITTFRAVNWENVGLQTAIHALHTEAVQADERRCGTFTHLGSETAVLTNLHALAAVLGFVLSDAATAFEEIVVGADYRFVGKSSAFYTHGKLYRVHGKDEGGLYRTSDDDCECHYWNAATFLGQFEPTPLTPEDEQARRYAEGQMQEARDAAE
jgi:hypothetical protein